MVEGCVVNQRLFDVPDELALGDRGVDLRLSQLEQKFEARHLVIFLKLEKNQESLILEETILARVELLLELTHAALDKINALAAFAVKLDH